MEKGKERKKRKKRKKARRLHVRRRTGRSTPRSSTKTHTYMLMMLVGRDPSSLLAKAVRMPEAFLQTEKTKRHAGAEKG